MLLTEEQARKETCPFIRYCINEIDVMQDSRSPIYVHQNCQASDCKMAWRKSQEYQTDDEGFASYFGYCGLAGRPE